MAVTGPAGPAGPTAPATGTGKPITAAASGTNTLTKYNTQGWYVFGAIVGGIALGSTPVAPVVFGILTLALIYQLSQLLEGK